MVVPFNPRKVTHFFARDQKPEAAFAQKVHLKVSPTAGVDLGMFLHFTSDSM